MSSEIPEIFKALLEYPFSVPTFADNENDKGKLFLGENADLGGGDISMGSAALTPAIWDKTIPYDGETFHLEYMDLDEFLMENGISTSVEQDSPKTKDGSTLENAEQEAIATPPQAVCAKAPVSLLPILELDQCEEEVVTVNSAEINFNEDERVTWFSFADIKSPELVDPDEIEVEVNFEPDPTDLVLSSVPGGELFNPRKHKFSDEDLKPQPMIKKAKKVFVPEEQKDDKYWHRRKKNNVAAKRSRDARRLKENQITVRAAFLERENTVLRREVAELRKDFGRTSNVVSRYEAEYGAL
ncbi:thyrotroph embryonic factor-like [Aplochiton taeniatus]